MRSQGGGSGQSFIPRPTPGVVALLIALTACYALQLLALRAGFATLVDRMMLVPQQTVEQFSVWQPVTSVFLHSPNSVGHLLHNGLMLWIFGTTLEANKGKRWLWTTFAWCGFAGSVATLLVAFVGHMVQPNGSLGQFWFRPVLGASGGVLGLMVAWIATHWGRRIHLFLLGSMKAETFGMIIVGVELLMALSFDGTASASHFGGMAMGFLIGRGLFPPRGLRRELTRYRHKKTQQRLREFEVIEGGRNDDDTAGPPIWGGKPPTVH